MHRIIRILSWVLACALLPITAAAQDITWNLSKLSPGDYVVQKSRPNGTVIHQFQGKAGRYYVVQTYRGSGAARELTLTSYLDRNGNHVRAVYPDGFTYRYTPHNCGRTLGTCRFFVKLSDGRRYQRSLVTSVQGDRVSFVEYDAQGNWSDKGWFRIDALGTALTGFTQSADGKRRREDYDARAVYK